MEIKEYIEFGAFNSKGWGMYLVDRDAPTPDEKEIVEDIPFLQGVLDFSFLTGERIFQNREVTYKFKLPNTHYDSRKTVERFIKKEVMPNFEEKLYDSAIPNHFFVGKCASVKVVHDPGKRNFIVTLVFNCYPFAYTLKKYYDDVWDTFSFDDDVSAFTKWDIKGRRDIVIFNHGSAFVAPEVIANGSFKVTDANGDNWTFSSGNKVDNSFQLVPGVNRLKVEGNGYISFHFRSEEMV